MGERPFIDHDGSCYPIPAGTPVDVIRRDGSFQSFVSGMLYFGADGTYRLKPSAAYSGVCSAWLWNTSRPEKDIVKFRRTEDDQSECDRAASYQDLFRRIGEGHSVPSIPDPNPIVEPAAVPARRREWSR